MNLCRASAVIRPALKIGIHPDSNRIGSEVGSIQWFGQKILFSVKKFVIKKLKKVIFIAAAELDFMFNYVH